MTSPENPCLAKVRDAERFTTFCALEIGHDGECSEIPAPKDPK